MNRRHVISLAVCGLVAGCRRGGDSRDAQPPELPADRPEVPETTAPLEGDSLTPVTIDPALEIRRIAGLRPYRPSGFVVRREDLDGKILVHNYGHGGGGMTLSWGSSELAIRLAGGPLAGLSCAVLGGGVMGLSTTRLLQLRGAQVTVYTRDLPPQTTSNIAGAQVWPVSVYSNNRRTPAFSSQFEEASRFSFRYFQFRRCWARCRAAGRGSWSGSFPRPGRFSNSRNPSFSIAAGSGPPVCSATPS